MDSMGAQKEELDMARQRIAQLEAEVAKFQEKDRLFSCEVCYQKAWIGCDRNDDGAIESSSGGKQTWWRCEHCWLKARVKELEEWKAIVEGSGTDQETVIRMAAAEYTKVAVQCWKDKVEQLERDLKEAAKGGGFFGRACARLLEKRDVLEAKNRQLEAQITYLQTVSTEQVARIRTLVAFYDTYHGTPCEQIRHQQEVEELKRRIVTLEDQLENAQYEAMGDDL